MKNYRTSIAEIPFYLLILGLVVFIWSCNKDADLVVSPQKKVNSTTFNCSQFNYSDTLYFKSPSVNDYIVNPTTSAAGQYGSYPIGLEINGNTGAINVTDSEAGLRYKVYFVPQNSTDSCFKYVTISGVDYASGIYNLDLSNEIISPTYKGLTGTLPCDDDDDDDDDNDDEEDNNNNNSNNDDFGCEFDDDEDDDDGDNANDEPAAGQDVTSQGVDIDKILGSINLKNSLKNGALGSNPSNGASKVFRIYYRLNDNSQRALNFIDVKLHYYEELSDVPQSLLNIVIDKNKVYEIQPQARLARPSKRPPDIVIVGHYN